MARRKIQFFRLQILKLRNLGRTYPEFVINGVDHQINMNAGNFFYL